ncbi:MAG TPA: hypothetical protein DEA08_15735, partial [Planctomycetes bacterium]|nr:hypothetical protein [Planctomycetota bacterium]
LPHSPATDVYGVGALLYTCLSGEPPFRGALLDVLRRVLEEPAAPLRSRAPAVDPALAEIVERCLAKDPHERYRDGGTLARELRAWRIGLRPEEKRGTWSPELKVGAGLCALALLTGWAGQRFQRESPPAQAKASSPAPSPTGSPAGEPTPADVQPFDADAELTRAIEENRAGKSQDALRRVERVLERAPSARAYGDYGGLLATQGDFFRAQQAYEEGLKHVDPRDRELWAQLQMRLALIDARRGQRTAQRRRLDEVLARWPNAEGYRMRSDARIALLDRAGALADIEESLRLEPRSADGLSIQGALLAQQGDLVGARKALETALELQPERESVRANLARIMAQARRALEEARQIVDKGGDSRRAERLLERALACGDLDATYLLAMAKVRNGGPTDEIKRLLLEAAEGGHLAACFDVGINYERGIWGEPEASKAEDYYRRAAEAGAVPAMLRLATLYQRGGRSEDAERWRQRAEEAGSADAKAWRADLLHAAGEVEEAMALWQEAREAKSGWACYSLALRAEDRCAVEEAAALLEEAIELGDLRACVRRGKHLLASGGGEDVKRRARDLFHRAAVQGNLAGVVLLGEVLLDLQDARAAAWLRRGAQRGAPRAMLNYGHYLLAQDGPPLHEEGVGWLGRALRLGERVARSRLETALKTFEASEGPDSPRLTARCLEALAFERPELLERAKRRYEEAAAAGDAKARARLEAWPR